MTLLAAHVKDPSARMHFVRSLWPQGGMFSGQEWRFSPEPYPLGVDLWKQLEALGRMLLQFNRSVNLLYRQSLAGKQPAWVADWLDRGKPASLLEIQRAAAFKNELPRVIRPDIILTETGPCITELDSVPGGIGLTAWLNQAYYAMQGGDAAPLLNGAVIGRSDGMIKGFASIFDDAPAVHIVISEEAYAYRPEMAWLAAQLGERFHVRNTSFTDFKDGDAVYRFFELFDLPNVPNAATILEMAQAGRIHLTSPPKPIFEEKNALRVAVEPELAQFSGGRNWAKNS